MRSGLFFKISVVVVVLGISAYLACVVYAKFTQSSRLKQAATAAEQFHAKEGLYGQLLASWAEIMPAKCGPTAEHQSGSPIQCAKLGVSNSIGPVPNYRYGECLFRRFLRCRQYRFLSE